MAAIYAPIADEEMAYGVLCIDTPTDASCFGPADLLFTAAVARYAAVGLKRLETEQQLKAKIQTLERILPSFSPAVRKVLVQRAQAGKLYPRYERSEVTLLYSDIRGFTDLSCKIEDDALFDLLNECFALQSSSILRYAGTIDNFEGDAMLAVFGSPEPDPNHHIHAVLAAVEIQEAIKQHNSVVGRHLPPLRLGIGIHSGSLLHGFVGDRDRLQFTLIGAEANIGSRYCAGAGPGEILISDEVFKHVWRQVATEKIKIETKHEGTLSARRVRNVTVAAKGKPKT
jgi:adenylate cyclase